METGTVFKVDVETTKQSVTMRTMLEDLAKNDEENNAQLLDQVLTQSIQWCAHKDNATPLEDNENKEK